MAEASRRTRTLFLALRVLVTLGAFAFLFTRVDPQSLGRAFADISLQAVVAACTISYVALGIGALRWMVILRSCGATHTPPLGRLFHLTLVGYFYNTMLPGAVGGDIVRGLATAKSFEGRGATSALAVTLLERMSGLMGLVIVASVAFVLRPLQGVEGLRLWGAVGVAAAAFGSAALIYASRLARYFPAALAPLAQRMPDVKAPAGLLLALLLSLGTQISVVAMGHVLVDAIRPEIRFMESAVAMPVVSVAGYFPLTVAGAGAREATLVAVYRLVGMPEPDALAAALALLGCSLLVAASGGVLNMLRPLKTD